MKNVFLCLILVTDHIAAGGEDYRKLLNNIMMKLLTKNVAITYSMLGRKGKKKFGVLKLCSAVIGESFSMLSQLVKTVGLKAT